MDVKSTASSTINVSSNSFFPFVLFSLLSWKGLLRHGRYSLEVEGLLLRGNLCLRKIQPYLLVPKKGKKRGEYADSKFSERAVKSNLIFLSAYPVQLTRTESSGDSSGDLRSRHLTLFSYMPFHR